MYLRNPEKERNSSFGFKLPGELGLSGHDSLNLVGLVDSGLLVSDLLLELRSS
jgi:hypothetical protein